MALEVADCSSVTNVDWLSIDTVLLDMDGTLLDLRFDNNFWLEAIPSAYAKLNNMSQTEAKAVLAPMFQQQRGTLNWYCIDYWSERLTIDIAKLKRELAHGVAWRPSAEQFLSHLYKNHCKVILITNAHPETLKIKLERVDLARWFDALLSSHSLGAPKESQIFWQALQQQQPFDPSSTLFIDDSEAVLAAAELYGIAHLFTLRQPDSRGPIERNTRYPAIHHFDEIDQGLTSNDH